MTGTESKLIAQIQNFRKKYYTNKIIRGNIFLGLIVLSLLLVFVIGEGLFGLSSGVRTSIFFGLAAVFLATITMMVIVPLLKFLNISKGISEFQIANIVKKHFPEIDDKLINLLELKNQSLGDASLAMAAIDKKTRELAPIPFSSAINLDINWKYAKYLLIPIFLWGMLFLGNKDLVVGGSHRLMNFNQDFIPPPPFTISVPNHPKELIAGQNYELTTMVSGNELPAELYLFLKKASETQFVSYPMDKENNTEFEYTFSDIKEQFEYYIGNELVNSTVFPVEVIKRPGIKNFKVVVRPPAYSGIPKDTLPENIGDFKVLRGSKVEWLIQTTGNIKDANFKGKSLLPFNKDSDGKISLRRTIMEKEEYLISLVSDRKIENIDTVKYHLDVMSDRLPSIFMNSPTNYQVDHTMEMPLDFEFSDDFGFTRLGFFYRFNKTDDATKESKDYQEMPLSFSKTELLQQNSLSLNLNKLGMEEGDEVEYFLKIWDNDYISGPKNSVSSVFTINYPSLSEQYEEVDENQENIEKSLTELSKDVKDLKEGFKEIQEKLLNQKKLTYDDKKQLDDLLQKQNDVSEKMSDIKEEFQENKDFLEENQMLSQKTLEKYEKLNQYLEELNNPKMNEMMEKLQEKMEELDSEDIKKEMENLQFNEEEMEKSLERTMELLKQLEIEQKTEELIDKLKNLKEKQEQLQDKLDNAKSKEEMKDLQEKQEQLNKEMEKLQKEMDKLDELKKDSETPQSEEMDGLKEKSDSAKDSMEDAKDKMDKGNKKGGSKSQGDAAEKMDEMIAELEKMQSDSGDSQDQENLDNLREIIENLLKLSFDQEDLREEVKKLKYGDPKLVDGGRHQKELEDDMVMVKDSLDELAKKVFELQKFITDETNNVIAAMSTSQTYFRSKQTKRVTQYQTTSMTGINNLANMLSQIMSDIQQQMKNQKPGSGSCDKPGGPKSPGMGKIGEQQKNLNKQMEQMMNQMLGGGKGMNGKKLAEMAAQQKALREQLNAEHKQIQEKGESVMGDLSQIAKDMQETENDLINKNLTAQTLERQQKILNRLLDASKALREKEQFENKRKSKTGEDSIKKSPEELQSEEFKNMVRQELLKSNQLDYNSDYIDLIEKYYKLIEKKR